MPKPQILITKRFIPEALEFLQQNADVDYEDREEGLTSDELIARSRGKQAIVSQVTDRLSREVLEKLQGIGIIAHVGVGYDNIDVAAASELGILVSNTPGVLNDSTADFAFALLMAAARRVAEAHEFIHAGEWKRWTIDTMIGRDIHHRTLGVIGMGRIGQAMARRGLGFSMRVLYNNRTRLAPEIERELNAEFVDLDTLLAGSDFISLHVPLTDQTRGLMSEERLRKMKRGAILVNTARGWVVDEAALVRALKEGWIAGAGLDVFEREPAIHPGLLECRNAVLAPHIGSATFETRIKMTMMAAENALAACAGTKPANLVNPAVWDRRMTRKEGAG